MEFPSVAIAAPPVFGPSAARVVLGVTADPEPQSQTQPAPAAIGPVPVSPAEGPSPAAAPGGRAVPSPSAGQSRTSPVPAGPVGDPATQPVVPPSKTPAALQDSFRLGYPDRLRRADLTEVAALALPGLAAILGFTAIGGFLGYRQAQAGSALRAAGTARFLP